MFDARISAFVAVAVVVIVTPGPDMMLIARHALGGGRRAALSTGFGVLAGLFVHAAAAAFGLSAVLATSATAFVAVKLMGAGYLVFIGITSLRSAWRGAQGDPTVVSSRDGQWWRFRQGLLTNVLNPKIAIMFISLLPQFVDRDGPILAQTLLLAAVFIGLGAIWVVSYAIAIAATSGRLAGDRARRAVSAVTGTVLVGLGLRLAFEDR